MGERLTDQFKTYCELNGIGNPAVYTNNKAWQPVTYAGLYWFLSMIEENKRMEEEAERHVRVGDTVTCSDKDDMIDYMTELERVGISSDWDPEEVKAGHYMLHIKSVLETVGPAEREHLIARSLKLIHEAYDAGTRHDTLARQALIDKVKEQGGYVKD